MCKLSVFMPADSVALSKRITASEERLALPGKHNFAFVDLESRSEADRAVKALNDRAWDGIVLQVQIARTMAPRMEQRAWPVQCREMEEPPSTMEVAREFSRLTSGKGGCSRARPRDNGRSKGIHEGLWGALE